MITELAIRLQMSDTIFSRIIRREIPATIVFENDRILAFRDINPQAPVHILIIPKKPIETLNDVVPEDFPLIGELFAVATELALAEGIASSGYRTVFNCNSEGGQEVYHLHLHLLGGRQMIWPPG
jgi:histidine triad (HIT) family protein